MQSTDLKTLSQSDTLVSGRTEIHGLHDTAEPASVDRYVILEELGHGSMGKVYRAYDPELDRELAVKVLSRRTDARAVARIVREARAMAQVSHPNVVQVYDAGNGEDGSYIAMELVKGGDAARWLETNPSRRQVLDAFIQAGRGLQAAHEAGLVHRDFKPTNVLISQDGRVKVADFGIVGHHQEGRDRTTDLEIEGLETGPNLADAIVGTPAYMAPEQHMGNPVGPRADQFAFCAALLKAFGGRRPFRGSNATSILVKKLDRRYAIPRGLPKRVVACVKRGLEPDPADRFASMADLCDALEPVRGVPRYAAVAAGALVLGAVVLHAVAPGVDCDGVTAPADEAWSPELAEQLGEKFAASDMPNARESWDSARQQLDHYVAQWRVARTAVCRSHGEGATSDARRAEQDDCLDATLGAFEAGVTVLMEIEDRNNLALELVAGLPRPMDCESAPAAADRVRLPDDPAARREVREVRQEMARADSLLKVGRFEAAEAIARSSASRAERLDYIPLTLETQLLTASVAAGAGRSDEARRIGEDTYAAATEAGEDRVAARAALSLAWSYAVITEETHDAEVWCRHAHAAIDRLEGGAPVLLASVQRVDARNLDAHDRLDEALETLEQAVTGLERATGRGHPLAALLTEHRAMILKRLKRFDESREAYLLARGWKVENFGTDHPYVATSDRKLGWLAIDEGDFAVALEYFERAHRIYLRTYGPDHHKMGESYASLGVARMQLGQIEESLPDLHRGVELLEKQAGAQSAAVAEKHNYLGVAYKRLGRYDEALVHYHKALQLYESELGSGSAVARLTHNIANLYRVKGEPERALPYAERTYDILAGTLGVDYPDTLEALGALGYIEEALGDHASALQWFRQLAEARARHEDAAPADRGAAEGGVGRALLELQRPDEAIEHLELALHLLIEAGGTESDLAPTRFALGRALAGTDLERAVTQVRKAADAMEGNDAARARRWLRDHAS